MSNKKSLVPHNIDELKAYVPGKTIAEVKEQFKPERISKLASNENRLGRSKKVDEAVNKALEIVHDYPDRTHMHCAMQLLRDIPLQLIG